MWNTWYNYFKFCTYLLGKKCLKIGTLYACRLKRLSAWSSHLSIFPKTNIIGMVGKPTNNTKGSACSIIAKPSLWPTTCITVTAPYVTAVQYTDAATILAAINGQIRKTIPSIVSSTTTNGPVINISHLTHILQYTYIYSIFLYSNCNSYILITNLSELVLKYINIKITNPYLDIQWCILYYTVGMLHVHLHVLFVFHQPISEYILDVPILLYHDNDMVLPIKQLHHLHPLQSIPSNIFCWIEQKCFVKKYVLKFYLLYMKL